MGERVRESARRLKKTSREMSTGLKTRARDASRKPRAGRSGAMEGAPVRQGRSSGSRLGWARCRRADGHLGKCPGAHDVESRSQGAVAMGEAPARREEDRVEEGDGRWRERDGESAKSSHRRRSLVPRPRPEPSSSHGLRPDSRGLSFESAHGGSSSRRTQVAHRRTSLVAARGPGRHLAPL